MRMTLSPYICVELMPGKRWECPEHGCAGVCPGADPGADRVLASVQLGSSLVTQRSVGLARSGIGFRCCRTCGNSGGSHVLLSQGFAANHLWPLCQGQRAKLFIASPLLSDIGNYSGWASGSMVRVND